MERKLEGIKVAEHRGTWYEIGLANFILDDKKGLQKLFLMESEQYGGQAASIIIDSDHKLIADEIWDGFDDLQYLIDEKIPMEEWK